MPSAPIYVPVERQEQFNRLLAQSGYDSAARLFGAMLRDYAEAHRLHLDLPGVSIGRFGEAIALEIGAGARAAVLDCGAARALLASIRAAAKGYRVAPPEACDVRRVGRGVSIRLPNGERRTLAPDLAAELADQLDAALPPAT